MTDIDKPATARKASKPRAASVRAKPASTSHAASRKKAATKTAAVAPISEASALHRAPAITRRVQLAIARELARIEAIIDDPSAPLAHSDAERTARTLATLARTLKEITQLGVLKKKAKANKTSSGKSKSKHDESMPRDLDEFRRELAQRLDALVAGSAPASLERNDGD